jgi:hypothetical protein
MLDETLVALEPVSCSLCGDDEAEPVAVGEDFGGDAGGDTYLAVRCSNCGLIYLTPAPSAAAAGRTPPTAREPLAGPFGRLNRGVVAHRIARLGRALPPSPTVLLVGQLTPAMESMLVTHAPPACRLVVLEPEGATRVTPGSAHGALLIGVLERLENPVGVLREIRRVLRPDGQVLVISVNPGGAAAAVFRGRHWSGYDFPRHRTLADASTLRKLAERGGFVVETTRTLSDPGAWAVSAGHLLRDWGAASWLVRALGPTSFAARGVARMLEGVAARRGHGGLLEATLRPFEARS